MTNLLYILLQDGKYFNSVRFFEPFGGFSRLNLIKAGDGWELYFLSVRIRKTPKEG